MGATQNAVISYAAKETSQFEITTNTITKLNTFKLTPTAKLVLLYLTTCYNPKHKEVFPKQKTIADKLGISEVSVTRAIQELHKEGLIISERKVSNIYSFTSRIVSEQPINLIDDKQQKDSGKNIKLMDSYIHEQTNVTNKEQTVFNKGGNVYLGDDKILADYAVKHKAKNVNAYINKLKETGSAAKIIKEYKKHNFIIQRAENRYKESQALLKLYASYENDTCTAESCGFSLKQLKK